MRIVDDPTGTLIAEGPVGWGITPFDGAWYIGRPWLRRAKLRANFLPGLCPYKFLYVWLDLHVDDGTRIRNLGWRYWLPNPLLPFIAFRVAVPRDHPRLRVEEWRTPRAAPSGHRRQP